MSRCAGMLTLDGLLGRGELVDTHPAPAPGPHTDPSFTPPAPPPGVVMVTMYRVSDQ